MYKEDLALNNRLWLIRHKTKPNQTIIQWKCPSHTVVYIDVLFVKFKTFSLTLHQLLSYVISSS